MRAVLRLMYVPLGEVAIDFWVIEPRCQLELTVDLPAQQEMHGLPSIALTLRSPEGRTVAALEPGRRFQGNVQAGIWRVCFTPQETSSVPTPCWVQVQATGAYPFIVSDSGVIPSHFRQGRPWLRFPASPEICPELWVPVPAELSTVYFGGWLHGHQTFVIEYPDHSSETISWNPVRHTQHGTVVPVKGRGGWWKVTLLPLAEDYHFTTGWTGLPLFFQCPPTHFPFAQIRANVSDPENKPLDARLSLYRGQVLQALQVYLGVDPVLFHSVPGPVTVVASRGLEFRRSAQALAVAPGGRYTVELEIEPTICRPPGWICGDHHTHSFYEDGAFSPQQVALTARGEGLDYVFLTDTPDPLLPAGLQNLDVPDKFLALPGQELMNPDCHFNALNTRHGIEHPQYGSSPESYPGPGEWIPQIELQSSLEHPTAYVLNHPAHFPHLTARVAYFRSWWLADKYPEITMVENSPLEPWYERLNAGRHITHLWTTDSHDVGLLPPGARRTYVHTADRLSEQAIVKGIQSGHSFNTREPGAWLEIRVNGATMGETIENLSGVLDVEVWCQASVPLERIEIVCNAECAHTWWVDDARAFKGQVSLHRAGARWLIALAYVAGSLKHPDEHVGPLDTTGLLAFTNPVYVETGRA